MMHFSSPAARVAPVSRFVALLGLLLALLLPGAARAQTTNYAFTGGTQTYTVPAGITKLQVVATGGGGGVFGSASNRPRSVGAVVQAIVTVVPGEVLTVAVGGMGGVGGSGPGPGGYNGGGTGNQSGGGGGATDLRRTGTSTGDYLSSRNALLVAGGGGGSDAYTNRPPGNGGTPIGGDGVGPGSGLGATTTAPGGGGVPGTNNIGGNGASGFNAAGGGGYYGGGGVNVTNGGGNGGGGSSFVLPTGSSAISYSVAGAVANGALTITAIVPAPTLTTVSSNPGGLGQSITLTGTQMSSPTALTINGANALGNIISNSGTSLVVRVPATAAASGNVSITTAGGTATAPFTVMAPPGNALAFDGVDDHVVLPNTLNTASFTFEAWVNYQDNGAWARIFDFGTTTNNWMLLGPKAGVGYTAASVGNIFFSLKQNGVSDETIFTSTPMPAGRWHHLAVTLATAGAVTSGTIYLDGVAIGTNPAMALDPTALGTLTYSWLGRSANGDPYLKASLDEVRIWNTARTAAEVRADMAAPAVAPFPAGLRFYLNMDQGTPATASTGDNAGLTTLYDLVGAQPATLTGFALASGNTTSNYVQSYAMVVPTATVSTARTATGFTVNWTAPAIGTATSYLLDVSTTPDFASPIAGSPFATTATSYVLTGLSSSSAYYYRVRALNSALAQPDQGAFSNAVSQTSPLPVELTAFTATASGASAVRLAWATASEKNSAVFEVERSLNSTRFERIGTVAAAGSSTASRTYELLDAQLPSGAARLYYRLKQVDADGTFAYSPVRSVTLTGAAAGLALYPNPTAPTTGATLTGALPGTAVTVVDALGRPVTSATADAAGNAALALPAGLPAGVYVVRAGNKALRLAVN